MKRAILWPVVVACGGAPAPREPAKRELATAPVSLGAACGSAALLANPPDLAMRGPWPVGVRTVQASGMTLEVWYPASVGSERGVPAVGYDLRTVMPPAEAAKIPDADNPLLACECARALPLDDAHGPYPVVVFLHGAAAFRAQSTFLMTHWASRGFVVVAPDLPGVGLSAALGGEPQEAPLGATGALLELLARAPDGVDPLGFVRARLGTGRALVGHSLGSLLASSVGERPDVGVRIAMAGAANPEGASSWLVLAGDRDGIAYAPEAAARFAGQPAPSRMAVVRGAGHLAFSDLCTLGADRGGALAIAKAHGVAVPKLLETLATDGCRPSDAPFAATAPVIRAVTAGVLEETLRCDRAAAGAIRGLAGPALELVENLRSD